MKLGVNLWTVYGWEIGEAANADVLRELADMGSAAVELVVDEQANSAEALLNRYDELHDLQETLGIAIPSIATALFWRYNLASQDPAVRQRGVEVIRAGCDVAAKYGAGVFLVVAGQQEARTEYARTYDTAVTTLRQAARYAADQGVVLGVENVGTNFLCSPGEYARFLADVDHPSVQAYLDFGNGMGVGQGYPENWITALRGRIAAVHAKDYDRVLDVHVCCGEGDLPWEDAMEALRDVGFDDYLMIETPPKAGRGKPSRAVGLHAARTSLSWLQQFM